MLKKIRSFMDQYAIISAFIAFIAIDLLLHGLGKLLFLLPKTLALNYLYESILIIVPIVLVFVFGFSSAFKKGHFGRGLVCALPYIIWNLILLALLLSKNLKDTEVNWQPWHLIVYSLFTVLCVGIREESIYRGIIQNIVAKKYANSVKGIWITAIVSSLIFGVMHVANIFSGVTPMVVLEQVLSAMVSGLVISAIYLRCGNIWVVILLHTLIDTAGLVPYTFLGVTLSENLNQMSFDWITLVFWAIKIGYAAFLLRPSKCKQICESFCFADEKSESVAPAESEI